MSTSSRPNVLVVMTDQQRWDTIGLAGCPLGLTPNLDRLGRAGAYAVNAVTPQPVCAPARAAFQTGRWPTQTGVFRNDIPLDPEHQTIAHQLARTGYQTALVGKWHLAGADPVPREQQGGYEYWRAANILEMLSDAYHTQVFDEQGRPVFLPGYRADALTDAAIRFLSERDPARPFLLVLSLLEPHHQNSSDSYPAPLGHEERQRASWTPPDLAALGGNAHKSLPGYFGQIQRVDECLGRLNDALFSLGLTEDTALIYTADHGSHFKTRNEEYKRSCHDSSVRIPMVFSGSVFRGGGQISEPLSLLDLFPTICDVAGVEGGHDLPGRSVLDILRARGRVVDIGWRSASLIQISESQVGRVLRTARWKYAVRAEGVDGWTQSHADTYAEDALYDLENDPYELDNLIGLGSYAQVSADCRARLLDEIIDAGDPPARIVPAPPRPAGQRTPDL